MSDSLSAGAVAGEVDRLVAEVVAEITDRLHVGEPVDVEEYVTRHPELADRLRPLLAALDLLARFSSSAASDGPLRKAGAGEELRGTLGDFRLIREVGRGGMGIVYEAEQVSLGRRVALKVLPFAATMDPRQLQRFHNEARAAASLHHEHIVPVHAVGCERAVHFYAMQFIEGKSLAELIVARDSASRARQPSTVGAEPDTQAVAAASTEAAPRDAAYFRRIAEWGIQAAEALEHAHSLGIVHRDVKPANLMVDGQGKLWVADFGLARTVGDAGLTMSGDLLGTLRYMSPEQALARHGLVDHRTDVYSLGATLYELVTGRPAVEGQDRKEILKRIADEEARAPHAINREVPTDLETIVLKALAKEPADRYATARELADDLGRFLQQRPIRAKRPTLRQRLRKWSQRHRHLVGAIALFLALLVVGLAASAFLLWQEREETRAALAQARTNATEADAQRQRAEANSQEAYSQEAYWVIEDLLCAHDPERSVQPLTVAELRQWQTETALRFLAPFCENPSEEPSVRVEKGAAYVHVGRVYQVRGERDQAQQAFHQALAVYDRLVQDFPDDAGFACARATALRILAEDLYQAGRMPDANEYASRAFGAWREVVRNHPAGSDAPLQLAFSLCLWFDPQLRDPGGALELAQTAAEWAPHAPGSWMVLGLAYYRADRWDAAVGSLQKALQSSEVKRSWDRTIALFFLAMAQWRCGRHEEAMKTYEQAVRRMEKSFLRRDVQDRATQAEAAALLGVEEPATPRAKEGSPRND